MTRAILMAVALSSTWWGCATVNDAHIRASLSYDLDAHEQETDPRTSRGSQRDACRALATELEALDAAHSEEEVPRRVFVGREPRIYEGFVARYDDESLRIVVDDHGKDRMIGFAVGSATCVTGRSVERGRRVRVYATLLLQTPLLNAVAVVGVE